MSEPKPVPIPNADTRPFWDACREDRFTYQRCRTCGAVQFYPRSRCVTCAAPDLEWRDAAGRGTVHSFTVVQRAPSAAFRGDVPYVLALIDLDEGVRAMMNVVGVPPEAVRIGMAVRLVYEERGDVSLPQATPV